MNNTILMSCSRLGFFIMLLGALTISCSKKEATPPETATATEAPQAETPAAQPVPQPTREIPAVSAVVAEAQAAIKVKDYEKAAAVLTIDPKAPRPMTGEQLMAINAAKANLQSQVAAAAAAGDPKAKAVYEKMRQDALYHR